MARVSIVLEDKEDGTVYVSYVSDKKLPEKVEDLTPAQVFAIEVKKLVDSLAG